MLKKEQEINWQHKIQKNNDKIKTKSCYYNGIINTNKFVWSYLGDTRHSEINYPYEDEGENVACVCLCMCVVIEN